MSLEALNVTTPRVRLGESMTFEMALVSRSDRPQRLMIDYVIHHRKANGATSPKVFKWKDLTLHPDKPIASTRAHAIKPITTRVYYPGTHAVELQVNGQTMGRAEFELEI